MRIVIVHIFDEDVKFDWVQRSYRVMSIRDFLLKYRSELLMWLFVVLLAASPLADVHPRTGFAMSLVLYVALLAGTTFMAQKRIVQLLIFPLAGLWMLAHIAQIFWGEKYHLSPYIGLALSCAIVWGILSRFTGATKVSSSAIAEAVISYMVIAVAFSQLYWILNHLFADCFNTPIPAKQQSAFLYFSLTTLTTVGYGDIQPVNHYVRFIAAFEAVVGVFYIAIVIARLVAGYRLEAADGE